MASSRANGESGEIEDVGANDRVPDRQSDESECLQPVEASEVSSAAPTTAQRRLAAALADVDLAPEATSDDIAAPSLPAVEPLLEERPPHHLPTS